MPYIPSFDMYLNESGDNDNHVKDKKIIDVWKEVYGKDFINDHPTIFKILKQRPSIDKRELKRIWDETYDEDLEKEYSEFFKKLK